MADMDLEQMKEQAFDLNMARGGSQDLKLGGELSIEEQGYLMEECACCGTGIIRPKEFMWVRVRGEVVCTWRCAAHLVHNMRGEGRDWHATEAGGRGLD